MNQTRTYITRLFGYDQLKLARDSLRSIDDRNFYAWIHYQDAVELIDSYVDENLKDSSLFEVVHVASEQASNDFNFFIRKAGAYLVACIQSIHTLPDVLAHAIYYSLAINLTSQPIEEKLISASSVAKRLLTISDAEVVRQLLVELSNGGAFPHLSALANHSKHRSIVFPSLNEDWTGLRTERHVVMLMSFKYKNCQYPQVLAKDFLVSESDRCSKLVVQVGLALNSVLKNRSAKQPT